VSKTLCSTAVLVLLSGVFAYGQATTVRVAFDNGLVTLTASDALVTDVLAEWARVGGTVISGAERLPASRITVNLANVPERDAMDAVLGSTAGYISAMRNDAPAGASSLRKLQLVLSSKAAPTAAKLTRVIDATIPESNFEYPSPSFDAEALTANPNGMPPQSPALSEPQVMPEMRFQYVDPASTMPMPQEEPEPEAKPEPKPEPKTKKPPSGF
jgi:hypothetical protein